MKLRRLTLQGFKSFADRTELRFHDGITAIVGPNGCGKSNISDAVRWVLGEQRASAIRSTRMDEAIFQGTQARRALNRAEVALGFDNEDRRLAIPYDEVEVRRLVFREGGSDYELNRSSVRLRDILDLCRDTGLGANAYTIIEQGMVDAILSDRNDERRAVFEEAAGIGRYKDRRGAAQRRLESAEADLARLADIIAEVESKVRALGRQRKRAERYTALRTRRLAVDVALARTDISDLTSELEELKSRLGTLSDDDPAGRSALSTAEADLERRRLEAADATRSRNDVAARLEETRRQIADRERELAVGEERRVHAERRLAQIAEERADLVRQRGDLEAETAALRDEDGTQREEVERLAEALAAVQTRQTERRQALLDARRHDEDLRAQEEDIARGLARLEAEAAGADARAAELEQRLERIAAERAELESEIGRAEDQRAVLADRSRVLAERREEAEARANQAQARVIELREQDAEARRVLVEAEDNASRLAAKLTSLQTLDQEFHGFAPAVAAALSRRQRFEGLVGPLAEVLDLSAERATRIEATLNSMLQLLVVRDEAAAERIRRWLESGEVDAEGGGGVAFLRVEAVPEVEALLNGLEFAGRLPDEPVVVGRRARIATLGVEVETATAEAEDRRRQRSDIMRRMEAADVELRSAEEALREAELEMHRAEAERGSLEHRGAQVARSLEELDQRRAMLMEGAERVRRESVDAVSQNEGMVTGLERKREERQEALRHVAERESAWDEAREEEAEARVLHARAENALASIDRRLAATADAAASAALRLDALGEEEAEHRETLSRVATVREEAGAALERAFSERDELSAELRERDERAERERTEMAELDQQVRELRRSVDRLGEERHRIELRQAQADASLRSIRDRLELEWGRPLEELLATTEPAEGEMEALRAELREIGADLERLGPINLLAIEEFEEESQRLGFLTSQRDDLVAAREELDTAIRQINRTARRLFEETFDAIRANFQRTFDSLFPGGEADVWLEDDADPLESAIEISASPRGKRTQRISQLSGGERALTALALLFAIYLVKPSPFCVLDEVDAPLDDANIQRYLAMLQRFKEDTQFIVITHNPRTMETADWIYGVTMEEAGVSSIVGVRLDDVIAESA